MPVYDIKPNDWDCADCGFCNLGTFQFCSRCQALRKYPAGPATISEPMEVHVINRSGIFSKICWVVTMLGCLLGGVVIVVGFAYAQSAPQEAVVITLGLACAVIPYCFARAVSEIGK